jgi:KUP system potassium uptake protein
MKNLHTKVSAAGLLITLGIVFGDIGTSPLYVMSAILGKVRSPGGGHRGLSCIFGPSRSRLLLNNPLTLRR